MCTHSQQNAPCFSVQITYCLGTFFSACRHMLQAHSLITCTSSSSQGENHSIQLPRQTVIRVQDRDWIPGQHCPKHRMTAVTLDHSASPEAEWLTELLRTQVNKVWDFIVLLTSQHHLRTNIHKYDRSWPLLLVTSEKQHVKWSLGRLLTSPTCQTKN